MVPTSRPPSAASRKCRGEDGRDVDAVRLEPVTAEGDGQRDTVDRERESRTRLVAPKNRKIRPEVCATILTNGSQMRS